MARIPAVLIVLLGVFSVAFASEPTIEWMPVAASGDVLCLPGQGGCGDNEILLSAGGQTVTLFLQVSGWDPDQDGDPLLGAYQGVVDATTYEGGLAYGVAHPTHPGNVGTIVGVDLAPVGGPTGPPCEGAYVARRVCSPVEDDFSQADMLSKCRFDFECPPSHPYCVDREDYVFYGEDYALAVSCTTVDHAWSGASSTCKVDPDAMTSFYGGTLLLEVPAEAKGTYNVDFVHDSNFTLFNRCLGPLIPGLTMIPAQITIQTGRCCRYYPTSDCMDGVTEAECDPTSGLSCFDLYSCAEGCYGCMTDFACDDGNACTDDRCDCVPWRCDAVCINDPDYLVGVECCDRGTGDTVWIDDGNTCTDCVCNEWSGNVTCTPNTDPCDDHLGCTYDDTCGDGLCTGSNINALPCTTPGMGDPACDFGSDGVFECAPAGLACPPGEVYCCHCVFCTGDDCDDGDPCTIDHCNPAESTCSHSPSYIVEAECCQPGTGIIETINDGDPCSVDTCDPYTGEVAHQSPWWGCIAAFGSRYLAIGPERAGSDPVALLIAGDPTDPEVSCVEGYVQEDGTLGTEPVFQTAEVWGTVNVRGEEIIPSTMYIVWTDDGTSLSYPSEVTTWRWADVNNDTYVNVSDIQLIILGIQGRFLFASMPNLDLIGTLGDSCMPQAILNVTDVQMAKSCLQGTPYEDLGCPVICP